MSYSIHAAKTLGWLGADLSLTETGVLLLETKTGSLEERADLRDDVDPARCNSDLENECRTVRSRGIGTVFAARTTETATRLLRDRVTIDLGAADLAEHLDNGIWVACVETEIMRRDTPDLWKRSRAARPCFMRYIEEQGQLAPSKSTMAYIFDDAPRASVADGTAPHCSVRPAPVVTSDDSRSTALLQPSASFLQSLREMRPRRPTRRFWTWAAIAAGAVLLLLTLGLLHSFVPDSAAPKLPVFRWHAHTRD